MCPRRDPDRRESIFGMKRIRLRISLISAIGLLVLTAGCAGRSITATSRESLPEERVVESVPLAAAPTASPAVRSGAEKPSGSQTPSLFLFDIPFQFDEYVLRFDATAKIEVNALRLKEQDGKLSDVLLEGRCDEIGTVDYNLVLGERRAQAVKQYLVNLGIPSAAIETISYGKERPVCLEHSKECWAKNRTVRFVVK
jgi:peptidoglycan-associated lipoprotein